VKVRGIEIESLIYVMMNEIIESGKELKNHIEKDLKYLFEANPIEPMKKFEVFLSWQLEVPHFSNLKEEIVDAVISLQVQVSILEKLKKISTKISDLEVTIESMAEILDLTKNVDTYLDDLRREQKTTAKLLQNLHRGLLA